MVTTRNTPEFSLGSRSNAYEMRDMIVIEVATVIQKAVKEMVAGIQHELVRMIEERFATMPVVWDPQTESR